MIKNKNIYKSLECYCDEFKKIPNDRRELGMAGVITSYTLNIGGALADYKMDKYLDTQNVSRGIKALSTIKITTNFGILNFLYKKAEGKSIERAGIETAIETSIGIIAVKTGVSLLTRIATGATTGAAIGSTFPIGGTIIGAVAGTLIAGVITDAIFAEKDEKLKSNKARNAEIDKQAKQYNLKINAINDYLIKNNYIELRPLNHNEAENLCKEASNLESNYFKTIELMLSCKDYLSQQDQKDSISPSLIPNTFNSHRIGEIKFQIQILDEYTRMPIKDSKLRLQNINLGIESITDSKGIASFNIKESEYLKPFRATIFHTNYQESPILDRSIIPNAIKRREKPIILRFLGNLKCYFNGKELYIYRGNQIIDYFEACSDKNTEPIKNGIYYININHIKNNILIYKDKECTIESNRIHITPNDGTFITKLKSLKNHYIYTNPKYNPIEFIVDYKPLSINLESIALNRIIEKHKIILSGIYHKPKEIKDEIFDIQKPQTYWGYKEILQNEEFDTKEIDLERLILFQNGGKIYKGENLEIDLVKYNWQHYNKQIIVFAFLDTDFNANKKILNNPKWRIITWHNPIINPRVTLFSSSGNFNASIGVFGEIKYRSTRIHKAIDFFAKVGTKIYAPLDCEVASIGNSSSYGQNITLKITESSLEILKIRRAYINYQLIYKDKGEKDQGENFDEDSKVYYLFYAHLSQINVAKGDKVFAGEVIGLSGISGNAKNTKSPHLHFEIRSKENGVKESLKYLVNPAFYIESKNIYKQFSQEEIQEQQEICGKTCKLPKEIECH